VSDKEVVGDETKAQVGEGRPKCDHICLKDDGHVERGEPHFYGYELPSPRATGPEDRDTPQDDAVDPISALKAELKAVTTERDELREAAQEVATFWSTLPNPEAPDKEVAAFIFRLIQPLQRLHRVVFIKERVR
jgi:hypothetical protein